MRRARALQVLRIVCFVVALGSVSTLASASIGGGLEFDYSTFLYGSDLRPSSSLILGANLFLEGGQKTFGKLDLGLLTVSESFKSALTPNLREGYVGIKSESGESEGFLGRKRVEWNQADEAWGLGEWSPRFVGDPLHPERIGKTGAFYHYESEHFRLWALASPVGIPERGFPIVAQDGKISASSPFWTPPASLAIYSGHGFPLNYTIEYPADAKDFLLRPNATLMARIANEGYWASAGYAFGPMQKAIIGVEPHLGLEESPEINATIHPRFPFHHLASLELGTIRKQWSVWGSLSREVPVQEQLPGNWYMFPYGPSWIGAVGGQLSLAKDLALSVSGISVLEEMQPIPKYLRSIPWVSRFGFERASRLGLNWDSERRAWAGKAQWTRDLKNANDWVSLDLEYRVRGSFLNADQTRLSLGVGADLLLTSNEQGFIGQYLGNDRVRWRVSYAF